MLSWLELHRPLPVCAALSRPLAVHRCLQERHDMIYAVVSRESGSRNRPARGPGTSADGLRSWQDKF